MHLAVVPSQVVVAMRFPVFADADVALIASLASVVSLESNDGVSSLDVLPVQHSVPVKTNIAPAVRKW